MTHASIRPAASASPAAGACRGALPPRPRAPVSCRPASAEFGAAACAGEPRVADIRISRRWMFLGPYAVPAPPRLLVRDIQARVEAHFGLAPGTLCSPRRDRAAARPRQLAMYLARHLAGRSLPELGRLFGQRNHTTVLHAIRATEALRIADPAIDADLRGLVQALAAPGLRA